MRTLGDKGGCTEFLFEITDLVVFKKSHKKS